MLSPSAALLQSYINKVEQLVLSLDEMKQCKEGLERDLEAMTERAENAETELMHMRKELNEEAE